MFKPFECWDHIDNEQIAGVDESNRITKVTNIQKTCKNFSPIS